MPMKSGYSFDIVKCPECGEELYENWLVRHMKREHPIRSCDHCWHGHGRALNLSGKPPKWDLICCHCGKIQVVRVNPLHIWRDGEHGEYIEKISAQDKKKP